MYVYAIYNMCMLSVYFNVCVYRELILISFSKLYNDVV